MSLYLPKLSFYIFNCPITCLNIQLVKRCINWNSLYLAFCFKNSFYTHMHILTDCFLISVPKANIFGKRITQGIIWKWKCDSWQWNKAGTMHRTVHIIICPYQCIYFKIITRINLWWLINVFVTIIKVFKNMFLYLINIKLWSDTVRIDDC